MQDADDFHSRRGLAVDHQMRPRRMYPDRGINGVTQPRHFGKSGKQVKDGKQPVGIAVCLIRAPSGRSLAPNISKVRPGSGAKLPTAFSPHVPRASEP